MIKRKIILKIYHQKKIKLKKIIITAMQLKTKKKSLYIIKREISKTNFYRYKIIK